MEPAKHSVYGGGSPSEVSKQRFQIPLKTEQRFPHITQSMREMAAKHNDGVNTASGLLDGLSVEGSAVLSGMTPVFKSELVSRSNSEPEADVRSTECYAKAGVSNPCEGSLSHRTEVSWDR